MKFKDVFGVLFISMVPLIELRGAIPVGTILGLPYYINYAMAVIGNLIPIPFILLFIPKILDYLERFKLFRPIVQWLHKKADKNRGKIAKDQLKEITATSENEVAATGENAEAPADNKAISTACSNAPNAANPDTVCSISTPSASANETDGKAKMPAGAFIGLMLFVLLPIPGTGAWTGSLVAALFGFPRMKSFAAIALGVLGCGVIMCLASYGVLGFLSFLL